MSELSRRAQKLLGRLHAGRWYRAYAGDTPKAMEELKDAGLVAVCGRVVTLEACFVPVGTTPAVMEKIPPVPSSVGSSGDLPSLSTPGSQS